MILKAVKFNLFKLSDILFYNCFCPSGLLETGPREGVVAAGVGVVEEDGAWAEEKEASTPVGNATSTDTAAVTNRESDLRRELSRPVNI